MSVLNFFNLPHNMGNFFLNLALNELLTFVKNLSYFENPIELHVLLVGILHIGVHDFIHYSLFNAIRIEFYGIQLLNYLQGL